MDNDDEFEVHVDAPGSATEPAVLVLRGELDAHAAEQLAQALDQVDTSVAGLVLDMSQVTFIDSSGLRALIQARHLFADEPGTVTIRSPQASTSRLLELTGLGEYFVVRA